MSPPSTMGTPADLSGWGQKSLYGYSKAVPPPGGANDGGGIGRGCSCGSAATIPTFGAHPGELAELGRHGSDGNWCFDETGPETALFAGPRGPDRGDVVGMLRQPSNAICSLKVLPAVTSAADSVNDLGGSSSSTVLVMPQHAELIVGIYHQGNAMQTFSVTMALLENPARLTEATGLRPWAQACQSQGVGSVGGWGLSRQSAEGHRISSRCTTPWPP